MVNAMSLANPVAAASKKKKKSKKKANGKIESTTKAPEINGVRTEEGEEDDEDDDELPSPLVSA